MTVLIFQKFLLIIFIIFATINIYATDDCSDVTCPDGWTSEQTGWIMLLVNDNPEKYCVAEICYCYNFEDIELPQFEIKKIVFQDSSCILHYNYAPNVVKENILKELIRIHQNDFPQNTCDHPWYALEQTTSICYWTYTSNQNAIIAPCDGAGYCVQGYKYCWDTSKSPWELKVTIDGLPETFGDCGFTPELPPSAGSTYDVCVPWCQ